MICEQCGDAATHTVTFESFPHLSCHTCKDCATELVDVFPAQTEAKKLSERA